MVILRLKQKQTTKTKMVTLNLKDQNQRVTLVTTFVNQFIFKTHHLIIYCQTFYKRLNLEK